MSKEQNDQVSELLDIDTALDDDEIVDLLEVVKPGKDSGAKDSGTGDIDFSADLDAMLEKLESAERALDAQDDAAPFPDPTPVDHTVDPDETLDMPSMDDLNNLLETLGAPADAPEAKEAGGMPHLSADLDAAPIMKQSSSPVEEAGQHAPAADAMSDLDELLAAADAADGVPAAQAKTPAMDASDLDALLDKAAPAPVAAPIVDGQPDLDALLAQPAPAKPAAAPVIDGQPDLDALLAGTAPTPKAAPVVDGQPDLDDLLGSVSAAPVPEEIPVGEPVAPDMVVDKTVPAVPAQAKVLAEDAMPVPGELPEPLMEEPAVQAAQPRPSDAEALAVVAEAAEDLPLDAGQAQPSTAPRYDEVDLNELDALLDDMLASAPASGPTPAADYAEPARTAVPTPSASQAQGDLAPLQEAVIRMENSIQGLQNELKEKNSLIESQQAQIAGLQDTLDHMRGNMDKLAAEAAAKVIREELAALLRDEA